MGKREAASTLRRWMYRPKLRSERRPLITVVGVRRAAHAWTKLGQTSSSVSATVSGRTRSRKRSTIQLASKGYRTTAWRAPKTCCARAVPVSVVVEMTISGCKASAASRSTSARMAFTSPTLTAWIRMRGRPVSGRVDPCPKRDFQSVRSLPVRCMRHAQTGAVGVAAVRYSASRGQRMRGGYARPNGAPRGLLARCYHHGPWRTGSS